MPKKWARWSGQAPASVSTGEIEPHNTTMALTARPSAPYKIEERIRTHVGT